ncbi:hypothetical protein CTAYLR_002050 [Chrysophaeum taylorii]|uniref:UBX domain-containing protein n=1 Tax=Chrysophaeum taylorii TaxID=2483200 RepID=A0AAD7UN95_9STRA|nr:hypothetical protein CTAYLR_002050 [Chrysophaeum taylorii]
MSEWDVGRAIEIYYADDRRPDEQRPEHRPPSGRDDPPTAANGTPPTTVFGRVMSVVRRVASGRPAATGRDAARRFLLDLEPRLTTRPGRQLHRAFVPGAYKRAAQTAMRGSKSLLVYIHSPLHQDTDQFCREVFGCREVSTFVQQHFVLWGADISSADGHVLSEALRVTRYPFLALLVCRPGGREEVVDRLQGETDPTIVVARLRATVDHRREQMEALRRQDELRREERRLRHEQDREFEESLEADRRKAEAARLEREREEAEALRARDQAEREARLAEEKRLDAQRSTDRKRARLGDEPPSGGSSKTARVRVQLPNGAKVDRRFLATHTVQHLRDFIDLYLQDNNLPITDYSLATNYPRRVLSDDVLDHTLDRAELNNKVVYVQDLEA